MRTTRVRKNGTATLQFRSSPADALGQITVNQILTAEYSEFDFTLSSGEVVHDYLQRSGVESPEATTTGRKRSQIAPYHSAQKLGIVLRRESVAGQLPGDRQVGRREPLGLDRRGPAAEGVNRDLIVGFRELLPEGIDGV